MGSSGGEGGLWFQGICREPHCFMHPLTVLKKTLKRGKGDKSWSQLSMTDKDLQRSSLDLLKGEVAQPRGENCPPG